MSNIKTLHRKSPERVPYYPSGDKRFRQMSKRSGMPTPYDIKRLKKKPKY